MDKKGLPPVTAIIMPGKNQENTVKSLHCCNDFQAEIIFGTDHIGTKIPACASRLGAALARAKGDYICILPAGTLLKDAYFSYPIAYLERHPEFDYSVCDSMHIAGQGNKEGIPIQPFHSLQVTDYFLGHSTVEIAAFIIRKAFLAETGILSVITNTTFPELLILPFLAFGYGVHIAKSLYATEKTFIDSGKLTAYISEAHDMIERFPISASDVRELLYGFDFMTTGKLLSIYDSDTASTFSDYICHSINHAFHPSPHITQRAIADSMKANKAILLTALKLASAEKCVKILKVSALSNSLIGTRAVGAQTGISMKPIGRIVVYAPLVHSAIKIKELLRRTVYEPDIVWAMNADGITVTTPDILSLTKNDIIIVARRYTSLEKEFSPANVLSVQEVLNFCAALTFPTLCDGNTTIRVSSGYFYDY
ncbi:MAG: hypothetical protein LBM60_07620 [Clostridium sp.]|jgi:hypothetical protein|nr:hypothetical protein [Clostridium sp.]